MKIAVCDDNQIFREKVIQCLEEAYQDMDMLVEAFGSGEELIRYYQTNLADFSIILLDIEMKQMNGIETAKRIKEMSSDVILIFLTSHDEFALTGYEASAFRFLLKPIEKQKLIETIESAKQLLQKEKKLFIIEKDREGLIRVKEILYIEAQDQYSCIFTSGQVYSVRYPLNQYEEELKAWGFYRIHRGYLVNLSHVKEVKNNEVLLENGSLLPISKLRRNGFKQQFYAYIRKTSK